MLIIQNLSIVIQGIVPATCNPLPPVSHSCKELFGSGDAVVCLVRVSGGSFWTLLLDRAVHPKVALYKLSPDSAGCACHTKHHDMRMLLADDAHMLRIIPHVCPLHHCHRRTHLNLWTSHPAASGGATTAGRAEVTPGAGVSTAGEGVAAAGRSVRTAGKGVTAARGGVTAAGGALITVTFI